ncbi:hypothetical protein JKF63_01794 [Porcisia hertigi]|uniref:Uncharacterized protein n=1 Tax=Porcisia hertigi TaxID=2761500 RepID=A0A836H5D8_9TRYP|nr:hypothetical protein JKF63_01794 [Porcisia hertigi]
MSAAAEVDPMVAMVESWDTYLVPPPRLTASTMPLAQGHNCVALGGSTSDSEASPFRYHLTDVCPIHTLEGGDNTEEDTRPASVQLRKGLTMNAAAALSPTSLLWLLTLVSRNDELLRAAAHLFLQFNMQFASLVNSNSEKINTLRAHHHHQLASLLEVTESHVDADMIVDSVVTECVVLRQQQELEAAECRCTASEQRLETELQEMFLRFLSTSAPDAVAAANRREQSVGLADGMGSGSSPYRAEVDISRFTGVRNAAPSMVRQGNTAVPGFSPARLVPVRTVKLSNEVGDASTALAASSMRPRAQRLRDPMFQPIILDLSPVSGLLRCLGSCTGTQSGALESSVSSAAEEHLLRLAHTRHSVLLFIGSESAAMDVMQSCKAPELLLGSSHSYRDSFQPLPNHPVLRILFTTRLWGANVVLLWDLAQGAVPAAAAQTVVEDALQLAYAWDADMFSVAVLEGARLPNYPLTGDVPSTPTGTSSMSPAVLPSQALSMEVLRQLRNGVTRELIDTAGLRRTRRWQGTAAWMQQGIGSAAAAAPGTHMCPCAVGTLPTSQPDPRESEHQVPPPPYVLHGGSSNRSNGAPLNHGENSIMSIHTSSLPFQSTSSACESRGPAVTFNTPLAVRVFLPLAEEYFIRAQSTSRRRSSRGIPDAASLGSPTDRGGGAHDQLLLRSSSMIPTEDEDASYSSDVDARCRNGSAVISPAVIGSPGNSSSGGEAQLRRPREAMTLESLIQYAFGDFAEIL